MNNVTDKIKNLKAPSSRIAIVKEMISIVKQHPELDKEHLQEMVFNMAYRRLGWDSIERFKLNNQMNKLFKRKWR